MLRKIGKQKQDMGMLYEFILLVAVISIVSILVFQVNEDARNEIVKENQVTATTINETGAYINSTGYLVENADAPYFTNPIITEIWAVDGGVYNVSVPLGNAKISDTGVVTNATSTTYPDVSISYTYSYTVPTASINATVDNDSAVGRIPSSLGLLATAIIFGVVLWVLLKVIPLGGITKKESQ